MPQTTLQAFIFDLDGVIVDTAEFHFLSWKRLADEEGLPFTRHDNDALRGVSRRESLNLLLKGRAIDEATAQAWMERKNTDYMERLKSLTPADTLPGVRRFLAESRAHGLKIGLGSASKNAKEVLSRLELSDEFEAVGDGYSVKNTKPAPDLFVWTAGRLGVMTSEAAVFEDAEAGIATALSGGFRAVGLGSANVSKAHIVLPSLETAEVVSILDKLQRAETQG